MKVIEEFFKKNKVEIVRYASNPTLTKEAFSDSLLWVLELLSYLPFKEQTERENFINKLPVKLINELYEKYQNQDSEILKWLIEKPEAIDEKYYTKLIFELIEERHIAINWHSNFFGDLEDFKNKSFDLIKSDMKLYDTYKSNMGKIEIPEEFKYYEPLVLIIKDGQSFEEFYSTMSSDLLDINSRIQAFSSDYIKAIKGKYAANSILLDRMYVLAKVSNKSFENFFKEDFDM